VTTAHAATNGFPTTVSITEVGPRDGLQAQGRPVGTADKIAMIEALIDAGVRDLEATAFVSPRAVPQLADAAEVLAGLDPARRRLASLGALVPNVRGAERAAAAGVDAMIVFVSASESHNLKNLNCPRNCSLDGLAAVADCALAANIALHGAIATAFGCPFEGDVPVAAVVAIAERYHDLGIRRITLGDTTGMATPALVRERCEALRKAVPGVDLALHFHNTRGIGLVNVYAGLSVGVSRYESSLGGMGGCPFAAGATGNVCTEDLVYLLHECGIDTGLDLDALCAAAARLQTVLGEALPGQVMKAGPRLRVRAMDSVATACG
jgi:hydroxymethylglutaryl-CoA lyase